MTVKELIEKLKDAPLDALVTIDTSEYPYEKVAKNVHLGTFESSDGFCWDEALEGKQAVCIS